MKKIDDIKARLSIFDIAQRLGLPLIGKGGLYHSPFRDDRKPSFSISKNGDVFNDFATGEKGDQITFYSLATGSDNSEAIKCLAQWAGITPEASLSYRPITTRRAETPKPIAAPLKARPAIPELHWSDKAAARLQNQRGYAVEALGVAFERGTFGFCEYKGLDAWLICDSSGMSAQARRVDGGKWDDAHGGHKAETLRNSDCSYPIGAPGIDARKHVCICEGSTDFLAAYHFAYAYDCIDEITPLAMLGAQHNINSKILSRLKGKRVLIFPDKDKAGAQALDRWGTQIAPYADKVLYFDFTPFMRNDGKPVKDLCDFMALDPDQWEIARPYTNPFYKLLTYGE